MADEQNTPSAIPGEPLKAGAQTSTPHMGTTPPSAGPDTLVATPAVKDTGTAGERNMFKDAGETLRTETQKLASQAADKARDYAGEGMTRATGALDELSKMITDAAGMVDDRLGAQYGQYARSAAGQVSSLADTLRTKEVDELVDDARQFVRKSPAIAIGTAAAVGFVIARLVKSGLEGAGTSGKSSDDSQA